MERRYNHRKSRRHACLKRALLSTVSFIIKFCLPPPPPPPPSPLSHGLGPALANENFVRTANVDLASFLHFVVDTVN